LFQLGRLTETQRSARVQTL